MLAYATVGPKSGGSDGSSGGGGYNKYSGEPLRYRREVYGPENELPQSDFSRTHSILV